MEERLRRMGPTEALELDALKNQLTDSPVLEKNDLLNRLRAFIRKVDSYDPFFQRIHLGRLKIPRLTTRWFIVQLLPSIWTLLCLHDY